MMRKYFLSLHHPAALLCGHREVARDGTRSFYDLFRFFVAAGINCAGGAGSNGAPRPLTERFRKGAQEAGHQELETRPIKGLEILFKNQSFENDVLTIHKGSFGETDVFLLKKEDKVVVRSQILF